MFLSPCVHCSIYRNSLPGVVNQFIFPLDHTSCYVGRYFGIMIVIVLPIYKCDRPGDIAGAVDTIYDRFCTKFLSQIDIICRKHYAT